MDSGRWKEYDANMFIHPKSGQETDKKGMESIQIQMRFDESTRELMPLGYRRLLRRLSQNSAFFLSVISYNL